MNKRTLLIVAYVVVGMGAMLYLVGWQTLLKLFVDPQSV